LTNEGNCDVIVTISLRELQEIVENDGFGPKEKSG